MKLLLIVLTPIMTYCSAAKHPAIKYTAEQLKALKPPLSAQHYTLKPKAAMPPLSMPLLQLSAVSTLATIPEAQSPLQARRRHKSPKKKRKPKAPNNSVDLGGSSKFMQPFPEIAITYEPFK